jgi:hypothetical protein
MNQRIPIYGIKEVNMGTPRTYMLGVFTPEEILNIMDLEEYFGVSQFPSYDLIFGMEGENVLDLESLR